MNDLSQRILNAQTSTTQDPCVGHTLNAIVAEKNIQALDLFINRPFEPTKWKNIFTHAPYLAQFWREQWYDGWTKMAPICAEHAEYVATILEHVSPNPLLSQPLVEALLTQLDPQNRHFAEQTAAVLDHAMHTNNPQLFDRCVNLLPRDNGFVTEPGFKAFARINVACDMNSVWAMEKIILVSQNDRVYFQVLIESLQRLQIEELKQLHAAAKSISNSASIDDRTLDAILTNQSQWSREAWDLCRSLLDGSPSNRNFGRVLSMGLDAKVNVPLKDLKIYCTQLVKNNASDTAVAVLLNEQNQTTQDLLKYIALRHPEQYKKALHDAIKNPRFSVLKIEGWLQKINEEFDLIFALSHHSSPVLDAWKIHYALDQQVNAHAPAPRKKM